MALTTSLVAYYKLDGNSNDAVGSNNGTDVGITYNAGNGIIVQGAGFNGTSSFITSLTNVAGATDLSVQCWFKSTQTGVNYPTLFGYRNGASQPYFAIILFSGTCQFSVIDSAGNSAFCAASGSYNDGAWHHVVGVKTGGSTEIFIDGISRGTASATFGGNFNTSVLDIGKDLGNSTFYSGALDECGYWTRALTSTEVGQLYNSGAGLAYPLVPAVVTSSSRKTLLGVGK